VVRRDPAEVSGRRADDPAGGPGSGVGVVVGRSAPVVGVEVGWSVGVGIVVSM
jgi:hypothetical protein